MFDRKDIIEIKSMWKKEDVRCDRFAAAFVDADGGMIMQESKTLMNQDEIQIVRQVDLVKKMFSMDIDNKVVVRKFEEQNIAVLDEVRDTRLKDAELMEYFFEQIRNHISIQTPYEVIVYHVIYDIPRKGTDGADQDESEDVYDYILCIVCQTKITKRQLAVVDGKVDITVPDRIIKNPVTGFIWPAFINREEDRDRIIIYNENPEHPEHDLYERGFEVERYTTTEEIRRILENQVNNKIMELNKKEDVMIKLTRELGKLAPETEIDNAIFLEILQAAGIDSEYRLQDVFSKYLDKLRPKAVQMIIPAYARDSATEKKKDRLKKLLLQAAAIIEDVKGAESVLARDLRSEADLR